MAGKEQNNCLVDFVENMTIALDQVKDGETKEKEKDTFNADEYWKKLGLIFKAVSHEATKLSLFSTPPPTEEELKPLITDVEKTILAMVSLYCCLPKDQGLRLRKSTQNAVIFLIQGIIDIAKAINLYGGGSSEQLQSTGTVWSVSDSYPKVPKNNKEAVYEVISNAYIMATDALQEIQEVPAVDSGGIGDDMNEFLEEDVGSDNENTWSERDKTLLGPCLGMLKTSKTVLKKTKDTVKQNADCGCGNTITQLDDLADLVDRLSPVVDEFAASLYPPLQYSTVNEQAKTVYQVHQTILDFLRSTEFISESEQQWIEFLQKANQHNWDNINTHLSSES